MNRFVGMIAVGVPMKVCRCLLEEFCKIPEEIILAHEIDHSLYIMRHKPALLVRITFHTALPLSRRALPRRPRTVSVFCVHVADGWIVDGLIVERTLEQEIRIVGLAERPGKSAGTIVKIGVFQCP